MPIFSEAAQPGVTGTEDFPTHRSTFGSGGHHEVLDIAARDAITTDRRVEGMLVYVTTTGMQYRLVGGITNANWVADSGGAPNRVVFQPGGPSNSGPVYNDWATLVGAVNAVGIPTIIDFDPEFATTAIPAGAWVFTKPVFLWANLVSGQFIQFDDGASVQNVAEVRGAIVNVVGTTGGSAIAQAPGQIGINFVDGFIQGGGRPFYSCAVSRMRLINCDIDSGAAGVETSTLLILSLLGSTDVPNNRVTGAGNVTFEINADSNAGPVQANTGTKTYQYQDPSQQPYVVRTTAGAPLTSATGWAASSS